jgi:[acyl-carrier-protein] S-malonyltransferase
MPAAVVFPGQGAQRQGMGAVWRDHEAWSVVERAEAVLDRPLAPLLLDEPLHRTADAQLAVLLCSLMAWEVAAPSLDGVTAYAGHSLGQVTALIASGAVSFADGLALAARRAEVTQAAADAHPGRMAALLGADDAAVATALAAAPDACWMANDNAPGQAVLAGTAEGVDAATEAARQAGVRKVVALDVDGAFHTPLMADARQALEPHLAGCRFEAVDVPVVSNGDAQPYADAAGWATRLADHLVQPVRWRQSLETLAALGADRLVEVGPGAALSAMAKRTVPDLPSSQIGAPVAAEVS